MTKKVKRPSKTGLRFSEKAHRYWLDGKPVPGVTTILGVLNKPALVKWSAGMVAEWVADNPDGVETLRQMGREPMINALKAVPWDKRDKAADRGSQFHLYAQQLLEGEDVELDADDELLPVIENALRFLDEWEIEPILVEAPVASREHWYAGTADIFAKYKHPVTGHQGVAIFDWKTSRGIYPEYAMQLNAYAFADFAGLGDDIKPVPECDAAFGLHLRADGYDVHAMKFGPDIHAEFVTIRETADIKKRMDGNWRQPGSGYVGVPIRSEVPDVA